MAASVRPRVRPLSPHMSIWKWRVHMVVSILHRATGTAMATAGVMLFLWGLVAAATGPDAYATFHYVLTSWFGLLVGLGFTWVFFQHMMNGIRHLVMDTGSALEIGASKRSAIATLVGSTLLTLATWAIVIVTKGV